MTESQKGQIIELCRKKGTITSRNVADLLNIETKKALPILKKMKKEGILKSAKKGRSWNFYLSGTVKSRPISREIPQAITPTPQFTLESRISTLEELVSSLAKKVEIISDELSSFRREFTQTKEQFDPTSRTAMNFVREVERQRFEEDLKKNWLELDRRYRWGGRVEIPELRKKMKNIPREIFNEYLMKLERNRIIDLQIASDSSVVKFPEDGINHPIRGLIYYVIWRK